MGHMKEQDGIDCISYTPRHGGTLKAKPVNASPEYKQKWGQLDEVKFSRQIRSILRLQQTIRDVCEPVDPYAY